MFQNQKLHQQMLIQQEMMSQQQMMAAQFHTGINQVQMNNICNMNFQKEPKMEDINVKFNKNGKIIKIKMSKDAMVAELIDKYFHESNTTHGTFKYKNKVLKYCDTDTLYEVGLQNNSKIIVN